MKKILPLGILAVLVVVGGVLYFRHSKQLSSQTSLSPTPTSPPQTLSADQLPTVSLAFSTDSHYVTVNITNLHADQLEYNLVYDAVVKNNHINTGVNAMAKLNGMAVYSKQQLLGSESSGHFTYHTNITNAELDLTLRDSSGRSIYTATYPFEVKPGASSLLTASQ